MKTEFIKLNINWNADPNSPMPEVSIDNHDILLKFYLNSYVYDQFEEEDIGILRFKNCQKYRIGSTNDEGWYRGQCRFSGIAPEWGEFYEIKGNLILKECPDDWVMVYKKQKDVKHYLFYFRDETFECSASSWEIENSPNNLLHLSAKTRAR